MNSSKFLLSFLLIFGFVACSEPSVKSPNDEETIEVEMDQDLSEPEEEEEEETDSSNEPLGAWESYYNSRFEFCVEYPANFLNPKGESQNRDGNTFTNANGSSEMRASGTYNALDETVEEAFARATEGGKYYEDERKITYKRQKDNWFVISGNYYESIFYVKTTFVGDTFYTLYFEYHPSEKAIFDKVIERNTKSFPNC